MNPYPLDLSGRDVVVFGGGEPALRQIAGLRAAGARVHVVAPSVVPSVEDLATRGLVRWSARSLRPGDLDGVWLAVAATGVVEEDEAVERESDEARVLCVRPPRAEGRAFAGAGRVTLVGGGPGDCGLLTVSGREALESADVIVTDRLAPLDALRWARPDAEIIDVAKVPWGRAAAQSDINALLVERALAGAHVVRFKGGDNFVFGRGGEELLACRAAGVPVTVVPGVSSAVAVPALAEIPVTHRGLSQGFTVVSGHVPPGHPDSSVDYRALAESGTTLVFLMAVRTLPEIAEALLEAGMPAETPAATIADGASSGQRAVRSTLAKIADLVRAEGITAPAVTVIGSVVSINDQPHGN
ncbi:uroporphyrinogen-III C-methyltransferase [Actinocorallia sp. B10E7]|uniref:uroporphyrinogen-III C-methyltransferase n=1 Tax=Actinocorallia sp. B10E7 TaxID=3153558 RepID=UPI00325DDE6B